MKQYISLEKPLCGIGTYKDTLNLDTGATVRNIAKKVFDGTESIYLGTNNQFLYVNDTIKNQMIPLISSHYKPYDNDTSDKTVRQLFSNFATATVISIRDTSYSTAANFKTYLANQYAAGTPVCVWYVLATPTTSTTALPHGLSAVVEGSLTQSGTPTPTNPIYPTANSINSFLDKKYLKYGTETDTITTLPKTIIGDGTNASAVIKGNLTQSGTPTPSAPIYPQECGDKTANLWNGEFEQGAINIYGEKVSSNTIIRGFVDVTANATYTFYSSQYIRIIYAYNNNETISRIAQFTSSYPHQATFTVPNNANNIGVSICTSNGTDIITPSDISYVMLNSGGTSLPYEPYGYKIPISSANTTTNVYLGEVQSTRQIKQFVLTGQENWVKDSGNTYAYNISSISGYYDSICSHYVASYSYSDVIATNNRYAAGKTILFIHDDNYSTADAFKSYLAQQYAAGTPVTVWYVLATATTGIVNEPIRKLGSYSDSVSASNIPTTDTAETFDVSTTLKPSEVQLTYHGWHEHSDTVFSNP